MMRNIFLLVFGVNILVFLAYFYLPDSEQSAVRLLPANVNKLVLLSEVDKSALVSDRKKTEQEKKITSEAEPKAKKQYCFTSGPFREQAKIEAFRAVIKTDVAKSKIRERKEKQQWLYWVYLESPGSRARAVSVAATLARKGLKDYYVIARGEHKNKISLGHFKDKLLAKKRFELIKKMKFSPKMEAIEKEYTLYWLDYSMNQESGLNQSEFDKFDIDESIRQFNRECKK